MNSILREPLILNNITTGEVAAWIKRLTAHAHLKSYPCGRSRYIVNPAQSRHQDSIDLPVILEMLGTYYNLRTDPHTGEESEEPGLELHTLMSFQISPIGRDRNRVRLTIWWEEKALDELADELA